MSERIARVHETLAAKQQQLAAAYERVNAATSLNAAVRTYAADFSALVDILADEGRREGADEPQGLAAFVAIADDDGEDDEDAARAAARRSAAAAAAAVREAPTPPRRDDAAAERLLVAASAGDMDELRLLVAGERARDRVDARERRAPFACRRVAAATARRDRRGALRRLSERARRGERRRWHDAVRCASERLKERARERRAAAAAAAIRRRARSSGAAASRRAARARAR